jgi:hypothetical protein
MPCGAGWHGPHDREDFFLHVRNLHLWGCCRMRARLISRDAGGGAARVQSADGAFGLPRSCRWRHRHTGKGGASHDARRQAEHATARHTMQTFRDHDFPMPRRAEWWPNRLQEKQTSQHWPIASLVRPRRGKRQLAGVTRPVRPAPGSVATGITRLGVGSNASRPCRVRLGARAPPGLPPVRRPRAEVAVAAQPSPRRADRASAPIATSSMLITMASSRWRPRSRNWVRSSDPNCAIEDAGRRPVSRRHEYRIA